MTFARGFQKICYQFCANPTVAIEASGGVKLSMALLLVLLLHPGCYPSAIGLGGGIAGIGGIWWWSRDTDRARGSSSTSTFL